MGCDIHAFSEKQVNGKWEYVGEVDFNRDYSVFGFLADVRNYDHKDPLSQPKGIPNDISDELKKEYEVWEGDAHSESNFLLSELLAVDYKSKFWNRRISRTVGNFTYGACIAEEGEGKVESLRENLGEDYFNILDDLKKIGDPENVRIVFWFDN